MAGSLSLGGGGGGHGAAPVLAGGGGRPGRVVPAAGPAALPPGGANDAILTQVLGMGGGDAGGALMRGATVRSF